MDFSDPLYEMFVKELEATGWNRNQGLGKNLDGATSLDLKTVHDNRGIGKKHTPQPTAASKLDLVYQGKISDINDIEFVESKDQFDKYEKKDKKKEESKPKKVEKIDTVEATKISMSFGRGRRQQGKLKRIQEQEEQLLKKEKK